MSSQESFRDDPTDGTPESDSLNRIGFAGTVVKVLDRIRAQGQSSSVVALIGDWGSGKSSMVAMIQNQLDTSSDGWVVAQFNPWAHSDESSAAVGFFRELRDALPKGYKWHNHRKAIGNLSVAISPLFSLTSLVAVDSSSAVKAMGRLIAGGDSQSLIKSKAEKALNTLNQPVLMIIDDLDRLNPDELLVVFKLVRLLGRLPNVYYLLIYDERTLIDLLMCTPLARENENRAHEYLEKLVQVRVDLPWFADAQVFEMADALIDKTLSDCSVVLNDNDTFRLTNSYRQALSKRFVTPRTIRRFFSQLSAFYPAVQEEVNFVDFLQISWIRIFYPRLYVLLRQSKQELTNQSAILARGQEDYSTIKERWLGRLRQCAVKEEEIQSTLEMLGDMFLPIRSASSRTEYRNVDVNELAERRGIGHHDYFDRYFIFGVPSGDLSNIVARKAVSDLEHGTESEEVLALRDQLIHDTPRTLRKLSTLLEQDQASPKVILHLLLSEYANLPNDSSIFFNPRKMFASIGQTALVRLNPDEVSLLLAEQSNTLLPLHLISTIIANICMDEETDVSKRPTWLNSAKEQVALAIREEMQSASDVSLVNWGDERFELIWSWRMIDGPSANSWFKAQTRIWGTLQTLMRLVPSGTQNTGGGVIRTLGRFEIMPYDSMIGLEDAILELDKELDGFTPTTVSLATLDTEDNRREITLNALLTVREAWRESGLYPPKNTEVGERAGEGGG